LGFFPVNTTFIKTASLFLFWIIYSVIINALKATAAIARAAAEKRRKAAAAKAANKSS